MERKEVTCMMNIAHLWWIVPLAILVGYWGCAIIRTGKDADERMDEIMRKMKDGDEHDKTTDA